MTNVKCNCSTCGFNKDNACKKRYLEIEGLFAKSKIGTFCQSFKNPRSNSDLKAEMAESFMDENETQVICSASYCAYNDDNVCHAKKIVVGNENAQYRSETQCDSFKLR